MKAYDQSYYDRWYRTRLAPVTAASRERKARLALAAAEFVLGREVRSVLDVGCGEGLWRAVLRRMRPELRYTGVDPSDYVVRRFGRRRNIVNGSITTLPRLGLRGPFDLIVCADVLAYVTNSELRGALSGVRKLLRGVAYIEAYTTNDDMVGDLEGWHLRSEREYRRAFTAAGLVSCGLHCWIPREQLHRVAEMERCRV